MPSCSKAELALKVRRKIMGYELSLHRSSGWKGQLRRIDRFYNRLVDATKAGQIEDIEDFAYAFFQNAFNIRDWIIADCEDQLIKDRIHEFFQANDEMGLCKDIANATKHFKLTRSASVDQDISIAREYDPNSPGKHRLTILADSSYNLSELAEKCRDRIHEFCDSMFLELNVIPNKMKDNINEILFAKVEAAVKRVRERAQRNHKLVITEADLQSLIYMELVMNKEIKRKAIHVHAQINYLKGDGALGLIPDVVLLPADSYTVNREGGLYYRKGYEFRGSSIALELKLLRSHRSTSGFAVDVLVDLNKLERIRETHYVNDPKHRYFAASVVFCRQSLPEEDKEKLQKEAKASKVPLWLYDIPNDQQGDKRKPIPSAK